MNHRPHSCGVFPRAPAERMRIWLLALALAPITACVDRKAVPDPEQADAEVAEAGVEDGGIPWSEGPLPPLASPCPGQRGMVGIPFPDGACYLMDPWPVTRGEYHTALAEGPLVSSHPACAGRSPAEGPRGETIDGTNVPGSYCDTTYYEYEDDGILLTFRRRLPWPPSEAEGPEPMVCVSWCDAHAYCERVGKRLCGNRALSEERDLSEQALGDPNQDELYNACTAGGTRRSPLGHRQAAIQSNRVDRFEYLPLSHEQVKAGGEGPFVGLHGMRVGSEMSGPVYDTFWTDYSYAENGPREYRECAVMEEEVWRLGRQYEAEHAYGGTATFRCCADVAAVP